MTLEQAVELLAAKAGSGKAPARKGRAPAKVPAKAATKTAAKAGTKTAAKTAAKGRVKAGPAIEDSDEPPFETDAPARRRV